MSDNGDGGPVWDLHGWDLLTAHDDPALVASRKEFLQWLQEVPQPHQTELKARLESKLDHPHYSARQELAIHHYFQVNKWKVRIHPEVPNSPNRPDFLMQRAGTLTIVECKCIFGQKTTTDQDKRLNRLAKDISEKLTKTVFLSPLSDLPPSIPINRLLSWIEELPKPSDSNDVLEYNYWDCHQGCEYGLHVIVVNFDCDDESLRGVHGIGPKNAEILSAERFREIVGEKARRYGGLELPHIISISVSSEMNTGYFLEICCGMYHGVILLKSSGHRNQMASSP